ncbi:MAG: hypothetical protein Q8Q54_06105, partial [Methylococcales bacterium]|nr:hypothetical protein [Methylococcales bacterium]
MGNVGLRCSTIRQAHGSQLTQPTVPAINLLGFKNRAGLSDALILNPAVSQCHGAIKHQLAID